jgi:hypothetical protein
MDSQEQNTLKRELNLKQYISNKIQSELDKLMGCSLVSMKDSRTTFSSAFSQRREDNHLPISLNFHEDSMNRGRTQSNQSMPQNIMKSNQSGVPDIAFRTGNFNKKKMSMGVPSDRQMITQKNKRRSKMGDDVEVDMKKKLSQSQIDFGKYNSKFSFAPSNEEDKMDKMKGFMFKTHHGGFGHSRSKSLAYSFDGTTEKPNANLTSFDMLANLETSFFQKSNSQNFLCHEFRNHKHFLLCFDKGFRKLALLNMDLRLRGLGEANNPSTRPQVFKISEELRQKNPRILFDEYAIFYTKNEFIVFDYQYTKLFLINPKEFFQTRKVLPIQTISKSRLCTLHGFLLHPFLFQNSTSTPKILFSQTPRNPRRLHKCLGNRL